MTVGARIKIAREAKKITQEELGTLCGTTKQSIFKYENGIVTNIPFDRLERIAECLDVSPAYLMGWEEQAHHNGLFSPDVTDDVVTFPVIGEVAAGYEHLSYENWAGDSIEVPRSYLHGRELTDFFVLRVVGDSMYPDYQDGDHVLVLRQPTMDRSGQIGVVIYGDEKGTLKRVEYVPGEDWMTLRPVNPQYPPVTIRDEALEHCTVLGVAKMVIRGLEQ